MNKEEELLYDTKSVATDIRPVSEADGAPITSSKYLRWIYHLDKFGVEVRGIERVSGEERQHNVLWKQFLSVIGLWLAGCGGATTMSSFFLPMLLYSLSVKQAFIAGIIGVNIGNLVPAYTATMGPQSGCRQMVTAKFLFGPWGIRVIAIIVIIGAIGWSVVNCVVGGQMLLAIGHIDLCVGIIVISVGALIVGVFGIKAVLQFQTLLAIPTNLAILLFYIVVCKKRGYISQANAEVVESNNDSLTNTGNWLSFFTLAYSVTATWGSGASDYYILFPEDTPQWLVFLVTFLGIAIPSNFAAVVGILAGCIAYSYPPWKEAYDAFGIGGIFHSAFHVWGRFGDFLVVVIFLSLLCNTLLNTYSSGFEFQLIDERLARVPRWIWATVITIIYLVLSLVGREHLSEILGNVVPMLGYWISIYISLLLEENILFRSTRKLRKLHSTEFDTGDGIPDYSTPYNWNCWDKPKNLTLGVASCFSFCCGVVGAVLGMNQVYYAGVLAAKIGNNNGDIGMWLCMGFAGAVYPILRFLELKYMHR